MFLQEMQEKEVKLFSSILKLK